MSGVRGTHRCREAPAHSKEAYARKLNARLLIERVRGRLEIAVDCYIKQRKAMFHPLL